MPPFTPTEAMQAEAQRGLDWRREYGRGGTPIGVARARDIVNGRDLPIDTVRRMHSFFARHEVDKKASGWKPGEDGFPSAGRVAWALWGGDPGQTWARRIVEQEDRMDEDDDIETNSQNHADGGAARVRRSRWLQENGGKCALRLTGCTGKADTVDHIKSLSDGGKDEPDNWQPACRHCNSARGANEQKRDTPDHADIRRAFAAGANTERVWVRIEEREVDTTDGAPRLSGLASVYDVRARVKLPDGRVVMEEVSRSAFVNTLNRGDIFLLWQHDWATPLARTGAGNLELRNTDRGLAFDAVLPDTQAGRDAAELVRTGVVNQMSFGFTLPAGGDRIKVQPDGTILRTLTDIHLHEVSLVSRAAYGDATNAAVRSDAFTLLCRSLNLDEADIIDAVRNGHDISGTLRDDCRAGTTAVAERAGTTAGVPPTVLLAQLLLNERAHTRGI